MILDKFRLDGCVAIVTGGTKGIGRAITVGLAEAGADLAVVSRKDSPDLSAEIRLLGRRYFHFSADLARREESRQIVPAVLHALGDIDILVNNAGIIGRAPAERFAEADWDTTLEIDLSAAFLLCQEVGQTMLHKGRGKIINMGSVLSLQGGINVVAYAVAKHGLAGLTKALATEWARHGINVNALAPSYFLTDLTKALQQDTQRFEAITGRIPTGRWGQPEDIAGAVVFLASPAADFVNGVILPVDGGWMAG